MSKLQVLAGKKFFGKKWLRMKFKYRKQAKCNGAIGE